MALFKIKGVGTYFMTSFILNGNLKKWEERSEHILNAIVFQNMSF